MSSGFPNATSGVAAPLPAPIQVMGGRRAPRLDAPTPLMKDKEVAAWLNVSVNHIYKLCTEGKMPRPLKLGKSSRWERTVLERWLQAGARPVEDGVK